MLNGTRPPVLPTPSIPAEDRTGGAPDEDIWTIVVSYQGARWLPKLFESLPEAVRRRTILIDNASPDRSAADVRSRYPEVDVTELTENVGFGRANNIGIRRALELGARHVFLLNQDCVVEPETVAQLARALDENPAYGIMSALTFSYEDDSIERGFLGFTRGDRVDDEYWYDLVQGRAKDVYELKFVNAAAVLVRGEVLREIGGFDPLFFMYGEDRDLCRRMVDAGWKIGFAPAARVRHWNGGLHGPTQGETLGWAMTMEYNRALLRFKSGRRSLGMAYAGFVWSLVRAQWQTLRTGCRMFAARLAAAVKVLWRLPAIARGLRNDECRVSNVEGMTKSEIRSPNVECRRNGEVRMTNVERGAGK